MHISNNSTSQTAQFFVFDKVQPIWLCVWILQLDKYSSQYNSCYPNFAFIEEKI